MHIEKHDESSWHKLLHQVESKLGLRKHKSASRTATVEGSWGLLTEF